MPCSLKTGCPAQVGKVLAEKYDGNSQFRALVFAELYDNGNGLIDRLVKEFPRFNDVSMLDGHEIKFYKLPQLGIWMLYSTLHKAGKFRSRSAKMTASRITSCPWAEAVGITSIRKSWSMQSIPTS